MSISYPPPAGAGRRTSRLSIPLRTKEVDSNHDGHTAASSLSSSGPASSRSSKATLGKQSSLTGLTSIFQSPPRRRSTWGDEDEDEEKTSPEKQELVRMRGRYSKAHMADFGMVFHSSELGSDYTFNAETADPMSGQHFHRTPITLSSFKPPSASSEAKQEYHATFATEEETSPRSNLQIGSFQPRHQKHPSSSTLSHSDSINAVAETTGNSIWSMWKHMKESRLKAHNQELLREIPTTRSRASSPTFISGGGKESNTHDSIDYVEAGKHIAAQLQHAGVKVSHNHLDVIHNLAGLERVWLKTQEGLEKEEFVAFLREVLKLPADELSILFQKMDANADGSLSWDEYLSYLLIEVTHHWQFRSARGTWHLRDVDSPATPVNAQVQQILVIPKDATTNAATVNSSGKYVFSCKDNSIQVWNSNNLTYQCHLPAAWKTPDLLGKGGGYLGSGGPGGVGEDGQPLNAGSLSSRGMNQTSRIGERRAGGARQKRCGGGGWKEETSGGNNYYSSNRSTAATGPNLVGGVGKNLSGLSLDETISRRAATHAGLARLNMSGNLESGYGRGLNSSDPNGSNPDAAATSANQGEDRENSNPFSRPRANDGVLHTTVCYYPTQKQLLVASMDKSIHVYQQSFRQYLQIDRTEVLDTPQCMTVHLNSTTGASTYQTASQNMKHNSDLLIVGDTSGRCSAYNLPVSRDFGSSGGVNGDKSGAITQGGQKQIEMNTSLGGVGMAQGSAYMNTNTSFLASLANAARPVYHYQVHRSGESVRKVAMIPNVGLVSAGMDAKLHISDLETERIIRSLEGHKRGVYSFAHCESHRCIFSAGFDSRVLVFDPYLPTPTGALASHHTNILDVVVNERKNQIITVCADKKIKIFDIRTFKCIQSLADSQEYSPYDELSAACFDQEQQQLVTAGNKVRCWPVMIAPGNKARRGGPAHSNLVVAICFSQVFQQIISVSVDENVQLWDIYSGKSAFAFRTTHGSPLTAACLDHRGKRLITGAHDGSVLMWNFNNGAKMHEFTSRKKEVSSLLYLPRTLQCVVGIGWERSVVRWPDPNAPKNTEWLVQPDHRAEVCSVAYFGSILVTGGSDGEIIVWHMDSARVNKRMDIPPTPRTGKRPGVAKMLFIDFPSGLLLLLAGTDDGSLHFIKISTSETIFSLFEVYPDPIVGMAANRLTDHHSSESEGEKFTGQRTRLLVCDCQVDAKIWDISGIVSEQITAVPLLKQFEPHPGGTTTDVIAVDEIGSFMTSSDTGEIVVWSTDGELLCKFAQRKSWPIVDPRTSSRNLLALQRASSLNPGAAADKTDGIIGSDDSSDEDDSDDSDSDTGSGPLSPSSTRRGSVVRQSSTLHGRKHSKKPPTPTKKEVSFAESHPPYVPKDECDKYLKEYQQQVLMEQAAAQKEKQAAERERREEKGNAASSTNSGAKGHSKVALVEMLGKLENDLKHQQMERISGGHSNTNGFDSTLAAIQGQHVYDKFHMHHSTGSSMPSGPSTSSNLHLHDPLGEAHERTPRPTRSTRQLNLDDEPISSSAGASTSRTIRGGATVGSQIMSSGSQTHRDRARVSFVGGSRTISNSDAFVVPSTSSVRKHKNVAADR